MKNILLLLSFILCTTQVNAQGSIIFEHEEHGEQGIYIIDGKASKPQFLTKGDLPSPSPDGRSFAYVFPDSRNETTRSIRIMNIASGETHELVGTNACHPRWSPKGDKILFECYGEKFQIWIADTNGKNIKMLLNDAKNPSWSPDGKYFAFIRDFDLYTYNLKTGIVKRIFKTDEMEKFPAWSPDGKKIAFVGRDEHTICAVDLQSGKRQILVVAVSDHILWTPQGDIIYHDVNSKENRILMTIDPSTKVSSVFNKALANAYWAEWINR